MRPGEILADRFEIEALAGTGGMGAVYRARDRVGGGRVALKVLLRASDSGRFEREAEVLAALEHPGIVRYVAHGTDRAGLSWLAMEWLEGEDLHERLRRGPMHWREAVELGRRIAEGLGAAHAAGVVHRDVKPTNVLLEGGEVARVRVLDFGIARIGESRAQTVTGAVLGTPGYLAPEQARGEQRVDARADVFALGSVLFECIAGRSAFGSGSVMGVLTRILFEPAPHLTDYVPEVPEELDRLLARMLEKQPDARPRDGAEVAAELARIEGSRESIPSWDEVSIGHGALSLASVIVVLRDRGGRAATPERERALRAIAERFGARIESLIDGSIAALISGARVATDQAVAAARCAIELRDALDARAVGVATGRAEVGGTQPRIGEIIGRAVERVSATAGARGSIAIDEVTADLIGDRFEVRRREGGGELVAGTPAVSTRARPCVGREREVSRIAEMFAETRDEKVAQAAVVIGEAGVGKSSVVRAVIERISAGGEVRAWTGVGDPAQEGAPFAAIASLIAGAVSAGESSEKRKIAARLASFVAARASDAGSTSEVLAELLGVREGAPSERLRAARSGAGLFADAVAEALSDVVRGECRERAVVWVIEDLHACDAPSIEAIDVVLRRLADAPLFVLATARGEIAERFPALWAGRRTTQIALGTLGKRAAEVLARTWLGQAAEDATVARIVAQSEGHPFFLEELARAARLGSAGTPASVQAMLLARFEALEAPVRRALRAASVLGEPFGLSGVRAIAAGTTASELTALADEEIVVRVGAAAAEREAWRFRHALLREVAYATLIEEDRALAHKLAAGWLERREDVRAAVLAEHWLRGGEPERAAGWLAQAAHEALAANDLGGAIALGERALACKPKGEARGRVLLVLAEAWLWRGSIAEARSAGERASAALTRGTREWTAALSVRAAAEGRLGNEAALVGIAEELATVEPDAETAGVWASALVRAAIHLFFAGHFEAARDATARLARTSERFPEEHTVRARLAQTRAVEARYAGDPVGHLRWTERALEGFQAIGDRRTACLLRSNLGDGWKELGRYSEAERQLREALAVAEELGIGAVSGPVMLNLALSVQRQARHEEAMGLFEASIDELGRRGDRRFEGAGRIFRAEALLELGRIEEARTEIDAAGALLEHGSPYRPLALAVESECRRAAGDVSGALGCAVEAVAYLDSLGGHVEEGDRKPHLALAEALAAAGDPDGARGAIAEARRRLDEAMGAIAEDEWRASFVANVPEHRRIVELARAWGVG